VYSVLLADDEESVLNVLKASIDWQELGVDTLLTASDGGMALDLFEQWQIDLLVTDIKMPVMDGIELIRNVRCLRPETHCVLLTAYSEFEYAKEAIRLGVDNYLLKPVAKEEVLQTIQTALDNIYQNRHNMETILKENMLRRWTLGMISSEELGERAAVLGVNLYQPSYCTICMVKRRNQSSAVFRATCARRWDGRYDMNCFWDEKGRFVMILGGKEFSKEALEKELEELVQETEMQETVVIAVGSLVTQAELLHSSYQSSCDAIETVDWQNCKTVVSIGTDYQGFDSDLMAEEICMLLYETSDKVRQNGCQHLAAKLCKERFGSKEFARLLRICIHVLVKEFPLQNGLQERIYQQVESFDIVQQERDMRNAVMKVLEKVQCVFDNCFARLSPMVQRTVQYIRTGVLSGEGVSLKELCARSGITPAYLGHIFKQEKGLFFNDYLLQCRIDRSVVLLRNPNHKIKDIAEAVGFTSTSYYVKCFRESKGVSPAKYRQDWEDYMGK